MPHERARLHPMIDYFALGLSHLLLAIAAIRLAMSGKLDDDEAEEKPPRRRRGTARGAEPGDA